MKIHPYFFNLTTGLTREGIFIQMGDGWGEIAPLPNWSQETLQDAIQQLEEKRSKILQVDWTVDNFLHELEKLKLFASVTFGLESALLATLSPLPKHQVEVSALLMGSPDEIRKNANLRKEFTSAKLKVSQLSMEEAAKLIYELKERFYLRIDVNRAWNTLDSLKFFEQFPLDTFDYVEEPFRNPEDLHLFPHPLAVDESHLSYEQLATLPTLKAVVYKPTIQGGMLRCLRLHEWAKAKGVELVLSSSFESDFGLAQIGSMAYRLGLKSPVGIGTYHYLERPICPAIQLKGSTAYISDKLIDYFLLFFTLLQFK